MNSQQLLYINFGIGLFFVLYFLFFRTKPKTPTKLNLRAKPIELPTAQIAIEREEKAAKVLADLHESKPIVEVLPEDETLAMVVTKIEHKIFFVYNAHEWECHEVLGLLPDSNLLQATERYQSLIKSSDPSTFEFYTAAFQAFLSRKGSRR